MYREDVRRLFRAETHASAVAKRICGSLDIYGDSSRHPYHSVNFITCHAGFTLYDLVGYNQKNNLPNGEDNRDGNRTEFSYNCGVEGPTADAWIQATRQQYFVLSREQFCNRVSWHGTRLGHPDWTDESRTLSFHMHGWHTQARLLRQVQRLLGNAALRPAAPRRPVVLAAAGGHESALAERYRGRKGRGPAPAGGSLRLFRPLGRDPELHAVR